MKNITARVYEIIFELLEKNTDGLRWIDLTKMVKSTDPGLHPKTINGLVWKVVEKYPGRVYRTNDKLFRLVKFRD